MQLEGTRRWSREMEGKMTKFDRKMNLMVQVAYDDIESVQ